MTKRRIQNSKQKCGTLDAYRRIIRLGEGTIPKEWNELISQWMDGERVDELVVKEMIEKTIELIQPATYDDEEAVKIIRRSLS